MQYFKLLFLLFLAGCATFDTVNRVPFPSIPPLPQDVVTGKLPGGELYFLQKNPKPENRVHLRLVVKAGSLEETQDQRGLAHFVEHMAFNGTLSYPKNEIIHFFESIGMRFGDNLNAFTSFDKTVYMLDVPADDPGALKKALEILGDWAYGITFDPVEVEKEKGVILEEARNQDNVWGRFNDFNRPLVFRDSLYANRRPIGDLDVIKTATAEKLKAYYQTWYRPENMALVIVGSLEPQAYLSLLEKGFGPAKNLLPVTPRPVITLGPPNTGEWKVFTDPELTENWISLRTWVRENRSTYEASVTEGIHNYLVQSLFSRRISKITEQKDAPFLSADLGKSGLMPGWQMASATVSFADGGALKALTALEKELESLRQYGFTQGEMDLETKALEGYIQRTYDQRGDRKHQQLAGELTSYFLDGEPFLSPESERDLSIKVLKALTLPDLNARFNKDWSSGPFNQILGLVKKEGNPLPDTKDLDAALALGKKQALPPAKTKTLTLMDQLPVPGAVVNETYKENPGLTVWTLSNGAQVVWKKTDYRAKSVVFKAVSFGGLSQVKTEDFPSALYSLFMITQMGVGNLTASELSDFLADKQTNLSLGMGGVEESFSGSVETDRLEILFQLLNRRVAAPRLEKDQAPAFLEKIRSYLANRLQDPDTVFSDEMDKLRWDSHPRMATLGLEDLKKFDLDKAYEIYRQRFSGAGDFTYFFVGDFDPVLLKKYTELYLGSLPAGPKEEVKDWGIRVAQGKIKKEFKIGKSSQAKIELLRTFYQNYSDDVIPVASAAEFILEKKLREAIREELGASYGISVSVSQEKFPVGAITLHISLGTDSAKQEMVRAQVRKVLDQTLAGKVETSILDEFRQTMDRWYETGMKENGWWIDRLRNARVYGRPWEGILGLKAAYGQVKPAQVEALFKQLSEATRELEGVLLPAQGN